MSDPRAATSLDRPAAPMSSLGEDLARTSEYMVVQRPPPATETWKEAVVATMAGWIVLGLVVALFRANSLIAQGAGDPWRTASTSTAMYIGVWLLLTPLLLRAIVTFPPERPWWSPQTLRRVGLLAAVVTAVAGAQVAGYLWLGGALTDTIGLVNLDSHVLDLAGPFEENLVLGSLHVAGWSLWRQRQLARWRELQAAYLAAELSSSRLQSLGMELRPHFLFNTLNAITGMVWADQATAEQMILQLSALLRRTLEAGQSPTCSLREEREVLGLYLAIQRIRFGERLAITVDIADDALDAEVPRFLLQPLVENAFQHGLARQPGPVSLVVTARREGMALVLRVLDDGVGLPAGGVERESTGVGNTRRRLATLYGSDASLALVPREGPGAESRVRLPWRPAPGVSSPTRPATER